MSTNWRILRKVENDEIVLTRVKWCASVWCRFRGLQLVSKLPDDQGVLFVNRRENRSEATIHMFFMLFSISVVWLDNSGKVVDKKLAKPWRPAYAPKAPARYFIEANPSFLDRVEIGDMLRFDEEVR